MRAGRILSLLGVLSGGALAWTFGGHDASLASAPPPRGDSADNALSPFSPITFADSVESSAKGTGDSVETTAFRLVDLLPNAQFSLPNLRRGEMVLAAANWRHMATPWLSLSGDARRIALTVALSSAEKEAKDVPMASGDVWHPDAHTWNMNEGDFPEKEALFAPTPSSMAMTHAIPAHARLTFSTALAAPTPASVDFVAFVQDKQIFSETRDAGTAGEWREHAVDLSSFAGQDATIRLETRVGGTSQVIAPALWGNPRVVASGAAAAKELPYNVLWIVIDALRPDVPAALHDDDADTRAKAAHFPIGDALLPRLAGLTPNIDALAARGVHFTKAYSAAAWTRPGTFSMLSGQRSSEAHLSTLSWLVSDQEAARYYGESPALLPNLLNTAGADTRAFVNNYFMVGYAPVGLDMGFPEIDDHRYRLLDTRAIADDAVHFIDTHAGERFFAFCNFNSPHEPYEPPERFKPRVPPPPVGPEDWHVQMYMGEAAKDDEAVGELMAALERAHIADRTIVVLTSDHGETLSSAHGGTSELEHQAVRFHHAASNYEETTHVPLIIALPGHPELLPPGAAIRARVRSTDTAPTILDLEKLPASAGMSGVSLLGLAQGHAEPDERVVVSEGRGTRAIIAGKWRLLTREGLAQTTHYTDRDVKTAEELYDLEDDPGERHDVAKVHPDIVQEMRARLLAALANTPVAGTTAARAASPAARTASVARSAETSAHWHFRFVGAGAARRISGTIHAKADSPDVHLSFTPIGLPSDAITPNDANLELSFTTSADDAVGFDLDATPPNASLTWELFEDDAPVPAAHLYGGEFGLPLPAGSHTDDALVSATLPIVDPHRDHGVFVTREPTSAPNAAAAGADSPIRPTDPRAAREMSHMLQQWGYARGTPK